MEWQHFIALTLFQPHRRLRQLFLVLLIVSDPLGLGQSWQLGSKCSWKAAPAQQGRSSGREPHVPLLKAGNWSCTTIVDLLNLQWSLQFHQVGGAFTFKHSCVTTHILGCVFTTQVLCMAILRLSWLGRVFYWSVCLVRFSLFSPVFQKILLCPRQE